MQEAPLPTEVWVPVWFLRKEYPKALCFSGAVRAPPHKIPSGSGPGSIRGPHLRLCCSSDCRRTGEGRGILPENPGHRRLCGWAGNRTGRSVQARRFRPERSTYRRRSLLPGLFHAGPGMLFRLHAGHPSSAEGCAAFHKAAGGNVRRSKCTSLPLSPWEASGQAGPPGVPAGNTAALKNTLWNITYATAEAEAGLCGIRAVGADAFAEVPPPSFLHSGQTAVSCRYRMRPTLAGVIRSSSRTST